ncbi:MAG: Ig-like domain-containing protein, partial [Anaerolineae bacterium]|nr:Ig-like domain-containing protein [Anaerolineae bacterium]
MSKTIPYLMRVLSVLLIALSLGLQISAAQDTAMFPPQVVDVQPLPGVELGSDEPLTIYFNQPMQPASVELRLEPVLTGSVDWPDARTLIFRPQDVTWPLNERYTVTITGRAANGLSLEPAYVFEAQTPRSLSVAAVTPDEDAEGVAAESAQISVTFDRPVVPLVSTVDQSALPAPLTFSPTIPGTGSWVNSAAYVFTPASYLAGDTRYEVTVAAGLAAVDGTVLVEPFRWSFRTLSPQVIDIKATRWFQQDQTILPDSAFEIHFSQPMDRESTEAAFALNGRGDSYYDSYSWSFTPVEGQFQWDNQNTILTFTPGERLLFRYAYEVTLATTAHSATGAVIMAEPAHRYFGTVPLPTPSRSSPSDNQVMLPGLRRVEFGFGTLINPATLEGRYTVSPEPPGEITPYVYDERVFALEFEHEVNVTYTITLLAGIEDIYGNSTTEEYATSYTVHANEEEARSSASLLVNYDFTLASAYNDEILLPLAVQGSPRVTINIYRADFDMVRNVNYNWSNMQGYYRNSLYSEYDFTEGLRAITPPWAQPENLLHTLHETFVNQKNGDKVYIPLTLDGGETLPPGIYGVEMIAPRYYSIADVKTGFLLVVTNTAITIKKSSGETLVWVTDIASGQPVPNAEVALWGGDDTPASQGHTDADGLFLASDGYADMTYATVEADGVFGVWYDEPFPYRQPMESYLYTDRPVYRPGETVYFRGVVRSKDDMTFTLPSLDTVHATATSNYGYSYYNEEVPAPIYETDLPLDGDFGTFDGSFEIPQTAALGNYRLSVESGCAPDALDCQRFNESLFFKVAEFRVPEYEVKVTAQQPEIIQGEPLNALVSANYY